MDPSPRRLRKYFRSTRHEQRLADTEENKNADSH